jgi:hypothetical protein
MKALLALPLLPIPLRALVTLISVSPTLYKGFITLVKRGVKVEVLDALAVGVAAGQGQEGSERERRYPCRR